MYSIDLNSDMGESFGAYKLGGDEEIIKYVTTANVAYGWHAGDPMVMDKVVRMAKERGVMVGAHPDIRIFLALDEERWFSLMMKLRITSDTRSEHWLHLPRATE